MLALSSDDGQLPVPASSEGAVSTYQYQPVSRTSPATIPGGSPPGGRRRRPLRRALMVMLVVTVLIGVFVVGWGFRRYRQFDFVEVPGVQPVEEASQSANWLLVGTDSRAGVDPGSDEFLGDAEAIPGERADTIMVARVDSETGAVDLLSIPRDLWVPIVGDGEGRINGSFNGPGGRERLVVTVENYLGIHLNHYVEINFAGFQTMVDALDGVPIWFDAPTLDRGSGLNIVDAGCHLLNGPQALSFARARSVETFENGQWVADQTADLGRTGRQREFLSQVAASASSRVNLGGVLTMDRLSAAASDNLIVDDGADLSDLITLGRTFASADGENFTTHSLPVTDFVTSGGAQVLQLRVEAAQPTLDIFRNPGQGPPQTTELSGDQTVPTPKASPVTGLSADELASTAMPGVSRAECR